MRTKKLWESTNPLHEHTIASKAGSNMYTLQMREWFSYGSTWSLWEHMLSSRTLNRRETELLTEENQRTFIWLLGRIQYLSLRCTILFGWHLTPNTVSSREKPSCYSWAPNNSPLSCLEWRYNYYIKEHSTYYRLVRFNRKKEWYSRRRISWNKWA